MVSSQLKYLLAVQLALSVFSRSDYLFVKSAGDIGISDVQAISESIGMPYWFWGIVCGRISVVVLVGPSPPRWAASSSRLA